MNNAITNLNFFTGGNATFTVSNGRGEHYTYRIRKKNDKRYADTYFIGLLTGPDNTSSYTYMGLYAPNANKCILTNKSKCTTGSKPVNVFDWAVRIVGNMTRGEPFRIPNGYSIQHKGKCARCGRALTDPDSIDRGFGPECWKSIG